MTKKSRVAVQIFNQRYVLVGEQNPEYIEKIAAYVDHEMQEVARRFNRLPPQKVAVLAALNMAETLQNLRQDYDDLLLLLEEEKQPPLNAHNPHAS